MMIENSDGQGNFRRAFSLNPLTYEQLRNRPTPPPEWVPEGEVLEILERSGLPKRHLELKTRHGRFWQALEGRLLSSIRTGFTTALLGPRGVGKTQLAVSVARAVAQTGRQAVYRTVTELLQEVSLRYCDEQRISEKSAWNRFRKPALLVIDELQLRSETAAEEVKLSEIVDARYKEKKDTLLISNLAVEDFNKMVGASIASRINETGEVHLCNWESFR